ncbi:MAG: hypothetical protein Q9181_000647 [Wetmoreana brouardii]
MDDLANPPSYPQGPTPSPLCPHGRPRSDNFSNWGGGPAMRRIKDSTSCSPAQIIHGNTAQASPANPDPQTEVSVLLRQDN